MNGNRLKKIRQEKGMSQTDFAKMLGVPRSTYGDYEKHMATMSNTVVQRILERLGITQEELFKPY